MLKIQPLITIGITSYNAETTIERCIISALNQNYFNTEIIIFDDCSDDATFGILKKYSKKNSKIFIYQNNSNQGIGYTRNQIIKKAKGEFLIFFDDDDESMQDRVTKQYKRIIKYENEFAFGAPVICHTARKVIYPDGKLLIQHTVGQKEKLPAPSGSSFLKRMLIGLPSANSYGSCATCSQMARLSTYKLVGYFDSILRRGEDSDFCIRLAEKGGHFVGIDTPLVIQYMTKTSEKSLDDELKINKYLLKKHRKIIERFVDYNFVIQFDDLRNAWFKKKIFLFLKKIIILTIKFPVLTFLRLSLALRNISIHLAFKNFHKH